MKDKRTYTHLKEHGEDITHENEFKVSAKEDRGPLDLTKQIDGLKLTIQMYQQILRDAQKQIYYWKKFSYEDEKNKNLLQGYKKSDTGFVSKAKTKRFMRVQDLQLFLGNFTKGSDAVKNAVIFVEIKGKLHEIRRMEVHENAVPIIGQPGHTTHRLVMKTEKPSKLILPDKLQKDY